MERGAGSRHKLVHTDLDDCAHRRDYQVARADGSSSGTSGSHGGAQDGDQ